MARSQPGTPASTWDGRPTSASPETGSSLTYANEYFPLPECSEVWAENYDLQLPACIVLPEYIVHIP